MSVAEIKREVICLTAEERGEVDRREEADALARVNAEMVEGGRVGLEELVHQHNALLAQGR